MSSSRCVPLASVFHSVSLATIPVASASSSITLLSGERPVARPFGFSRPRRSATVASASFAELGATAYPADKATPGALQAHLKAEINKWGPIIKAAGVYAD